MPSPLRITLILMSPNSGSVTFSKRIWESRSNASSRLALMRLLKSIAGSSSSRASFRKPDNRLRAGHGDRKASAESFEPLPAVVMDTLTSLALAVDAKDQFTQGHSQKVSGYAVLIAEAMQLSSAEIEEIRLGGMLHDVGKVGIPESILNKCGPLNPDEWETMKRHVEYGAKLLEPLRGTDRVCSMVRHHHEFFDGSGYPQGFAGSQIPLGSRIIAIADAYDTITSERTYKKAHTPEEAFLELERCGGAQFDPELVRTFVSRLRHLPNPLIEPVLVSERETITK
jgi:putative two-component system response regulator